VKFEYFHYLRVLADISQNRGDRSFEDCWKAAGEESITPDRVQITSNLERIDCHSNTVTSTTHDVSGIDPATVHMSSELARRLTRYVKWHWEWSGLAAAEVWPFGDLSPATLYRTLGGERDWSSTFAARILTFIARCTGRAPRAVWREMIHSPTQRLLMLYEGEGGSVRRQLPLNHSGRKLHRELMSHEVDGECSITYQVYPDLGWLNDGFVNRFARGCQYDCSDDPWGYRNGALEVREFARDRRAHLLRPPHRGPSSRIFLMSSKFFEDFALSKGIFSNCEQKDVLESLAFLADELVADDRLQFGVFRGGDRHGGKYPPALKLALWGAGGWRYCPYEQQPHAIPLDFFAHYHVVDNGRIEVARPHGATLCHVYTAPKAARDRSFAGFHWNWLQSMLARLCHRPDAKSTRDYIYSYLNRSVCPAKAKEKARRARPTADTLAPPEADRPALSKGRAKAAEFIRRLNAQFEDTH
jgi:hypothetical protein